MLMHERLRQIKQHQQEEFEQHKFDGEPQDEQQVRELLKEMHDLGTMKRVEGNKNDLPTKAEIERLMLDIMWWATHVMVAYDRGYYRKEGGGRAERTEDVQDMIKNLMYLMKSPEQPI